MKTKHKFKVPPIVLISLIFGVGFVLTRLPPKNSDSRFSFGDKLLINDNPSKAKKDGVEAISKGDSQEAIAAFQTSLTQHPNDPETLIYLNNAKAEDRDSLKIAVVVPISSNLNIAQEMLRGVAMAQDEINQKGGINSKFLKVEIVNDENDPEVAKQVAETLVKDNNILGVIGHNSSNASVAAAPIYQQGQLVMITPTSFANDLSGFGSYIFRTVPTIRYMSDPVAQYVVKTARKTKVAICYDSQAPDNVSSKDEFVASLLSKGGNIAPTVCDFSAPTFNPNQAVADAVSSGADSLLLAPHVDRLEKAMEVARANRGRLALFSTPTLYTIKTLQSGQEDVNGLVLPVPWHPKSGSAQAFATQARQLWGGEINWRTATAYDATRAAIAGLQKSQTREGLQAVLRSQGFSAIGANGDVKFLPTGDRLGKAILIQVQPSASGYEFVPIQP
ncbi:MAG: ABC transporter substrate-binding protein [Aphanothece sp. CMT-3BRIN-NPC111]|nr:ABC transporter substrate-binding protein [Aphanothece sp. CMT-3BRIN-NPC111]